MLPDDYNPFSAEQVVARNTTYNQYLSEFEGRHGEWFDGEVIVIGPHTYQHQKLLSLLTLLFYTYLNRENSFGRFSICRYSVNMGEQFPKREPDVVIAANNKRHLFTKMFFSGVPDIMIEIVEPASVQRDYYNKYLEYQAAGVAEYWIIDPLRQIVDLHFIGEDKVYHRAPLDDQGRMTSTLLPDFAIDPDLFWREDEPMGQELVALVQAMLKE